MRDGRGSNKEWVARLAMQVTVPYHNFSKQDITWQHLSSWNPYPFSWGLSNQLSLFSNLAHIWP